MIIMALRPKVVNGKVVYEKDERNWFKLADFKSMDAILSPAGVHEVP
ncbi:MAG: hypothetical protein QXQ54_08120 [Thermoplasmata archaeon]